MKKRRIVLCDVALREGAQVENGAMMFEDQIEYVKLLMNNGIDRIEIGYPSSSNEEMEKCKRIVDFAKSHSIKKKPLLVCLARAIESDIDAVKATGCDICHIYIPSSDQLLLAMFGAEIYGKTPKKKREWAISQAVAMIKYARSLGFKHVQYSPEDAARCGFKYLVRIVTAVINAGADLVNIPDTTGLRVGNEFGDLIRDLVREVPNIQKAVISVHCHNDSDHATNNAMQAMLSGAGQIEGSFYGLGERSGMTKFESVIMNIYSRPDVFGHWQVNFNPQACVRIVNFIANALGMKVPRHWPVVGWQNSICSSGTHQAVEKRAEEQGMASAYYSWDPSMFGHDGVENKLTQYSGREGIAKKLKELGFKVTRSQLDVIAKKVNQLSHSKKDLAINDRELAAIVQEVIAEIPFPIIIKNCQVIGGIGTIPQAAVNIEADRKNELKTAIGNGPFDALMKAIWKGAAGIFPILNEVDFVLDKWSIEAITRETASLADSYIRIAINSQGRVNYYSGRSVNADTIQAVADSFSKCLSWFLYSAKK